MWHGATVRSTIPRGLIRSIAFDAASTGASSRSSPPPISPARIIIQLIVADQPCLADGKVNHCEEADRAAGASRQAQAARGSWPPCASSTIRCRRLHHRGERTPGSDRVGRRQPAEELPARKGRRGFRVGHARRTSSKASTAPARRSISTSRTRASSPSTARKAASRCGARCSAPITSSSRCARSSICPRKKCA